MNRRQKLGLFLCVTVLSVSLDICASEENILPFCEETVEVQSETITEGQAAAESQAESVTEAVTDACVELSTEIQTETAVEESEELMTEALTEGQTEKSTEAEPEKLTENQIENQTEDLTEGLTEKETEFFAGTEPVTERCTEIASEQQTEYDTEGTVTLEERIEETNPDRELTFLITWEGEHPAYGKEIVLTAVPEGYEGLEYTVFWQADKGDGWEVYEGAEELTCSFILDEENQNWKWRAGIEIVGVNGPTAQE